MKKKLFNMKRAKQRYKAAKTHLGEGFRLPPLKTWIKEHYKEFGTDIQFSPKLERIVLR